MFACRTNASERAIDHDKAYDIIRHLDLIKPRNAMHSGPLVDYNRISTSHAWYKVSGTGSELPGNFACQYFLSLSGGLNTHCLGDVMNKVSMQASNNTAGKNLAPIAYSVADAVKVSGIGRTTLYALIGSHALPSVRIGSRRLIRRVDLEELFQQKIVRKSN